MKRSLDAFPSGPGLPVPGARRPPAFGSVLIGGAFVLAVFSPLLLGCGDDGTGPSGPFSLTVTATTRFAEIDFADEQPYLCEYRCFARTEGGEKGEFADWLGGRLDWVAADSVIYSFQLSADDLLDRFGNTTIGRNKRQDFVRSASGNDPYDLRIVLSARHSSGEVLTDSTLIVCDFPPDVMSTGNLAGSWTATRLRWSSTETNIWQAELVGSGGSLVFTLNENGSFSGSTRYPSLAGGLEDLAVSGTLSVLESASVTRGTVSLAFAEGPYGTLQGTLLRVQNELFLEVPEGASFDFNRDGTPDPASFEAKFVLN